MARSNVRNRANGIDPDKEIEQAVTNATVAIAIQSLDKRVGKIEAFILGGLITLVLNLAAWIGVLLKLK